MVQEMILFASQEDPRFSPVQKEELLEIDIHLSIISPPQQKDPQELQLGVHGVLIMKGECSALHLPHIAEERGWTLETLLEKTCLKGGLSQDAWKQGAQVLSFKTQQFFDSI